MIFKQVLKTLLLGVVSGIAVAAGSWTWKNCMEKEANILKAKCTRPKKDPA